MNMKNITLVTIADACGGKLFGTDGMAQERLKEEASCVVIDSRKIEKGCIFIATKGEKVDGHEFIPSVAQKGALGVICERAPKDCRIPYVLVEDSFKALKDLAEFYRMQLTLPVVGITGSVGKTSTKEFIASVLSQKFRVLKTQGNFNNEVGLPLTVLSIRKEHQAAVLEMGISDFGEMHRLSKIARPDICVMTNIGQCHLENLGSREGILKAKSEIFDFMNPDGHVLVNGDDDLLAKIGKKGNHPPIHFGMNPQNEIYASNVEGKGLLGSSAVIHGFLKVLPVEIPLPGEHMVWNALAAAGVGFLMGLTPKEIQRGIGKVESVSMRAAIDLLATAKERKVAVLGDMFELGECEAKLHGEVGAYAADAGIDVLICVGKLSRCMYEQGKRHMAARPKKGQVYYFTTRDEMLEKLPELLKKQDAVLVKASHGMQFEKVVEKILDGVNI